MLVPVHSIAAIVYIRAYLFVISISQFKFLAFFAHIFSVGETTADRSSRIAKKRILESHLLHSEHHMDWENRSGERDLKHMRRSLALERKQSSRNPYHKFNFKVYIMSKHSYHI